jgi:myo-inositol-1(or 4)-monophosphatase
MIDRARLEEICREAGRMALRQWPGAGHALDSWEKVPGSPVCTADLEVDAFLRPRARPAAARRRVAVGGDRRRSRAAAHDLVWLVDPIDGTRDFIAGRAGLGGARSR